MLGIVQILVIALGMRFFERRWPLEKTGDDRLVGVDRVYTVLNKLGIIPLAVFIVSLSDHQRDRATWCARGASCRPGSSSCCRGCMTTRSAPSWSISRSTISPPTGCTAPSTRFSWWWALHSLHHSQRQVTVWSDDRNHIARRPADHPGAGRLRAVRRRPARRLRPDPDDRAPDRELVARQCRHELRPAGRAADRGAALPPPAPRAGQSRRAATSTTTISRRCSRSGTCCSARRSTTASTARPASTIRWSMPTTAAAGWPSR